MILGLLTLTGGACTSGDDDGSSGGFGETADIGEAAGQALTALTGGRVELDSGAAGVEIPAGAMSEDAFVSIEAIDPAMLPAQSRLASSAFDFTVDDGSSTFATPVTLTMKVDQAAVPAGAKLAISWLNGGAWEELDDSEMVGDDEIMARTDHFSTFAVTFTVVSGGGTVQTGGMCDLSRFSACGGDPTGTWTVSESCLTTNVDLGFEEIGGDCEGLSVSTVLDYDGTISFDSDGSYQTNLQASASSEVRYPKSCLAASGVESCSQLGPEAVDTGDTCVFADSSDVENVMEAGTWETSGNMITLAQGGDSQSPAEYCVSGNRMTININETSDVAANILLELSR